MIHDDTNLHEMLLQIIEDETDPAAFAGAVDKLREQYGSETYVELLLILANIRSQPEAAEKLWQSACRNQNTLSKQLGRPVNTAVALLDYVLNEEDGPIRRAKVIDLWDYERIAQSAIRDGLTGIYNPGYIREQVSWELSKDLRYRKGGAIVLFDLNKFKQCNDEYGHLAGDAVLREFASILQTHTRRTDAVGRYGGDEFLALMPSTPMEGAFIVADRIRRTFEKTAVQVPIAPPEGIRITATGGIAQYMEGNRTTSDELIEAADQALYLGKREGANRIYTEWIVKEDVIPLTSECIRSVKRIEHTVPPKTIGNRRFLMETTTPMAAGQMFSCKLTLPGTNEHAAGCGLILEATVQQNGMYNIMFQMVEREVLDWVPVNRFIIEYERLQDRHASASDQ